MFQKRIRHILKDTHSIQEADNYDLTINSSTYGIDGSVDLIMRIVAKNRMTEA